MSICTTPSNTVNSKYSHIVKINSQHYTKIYLFVNASRHTPRVPVSAVYHFTTLTSTSLCIDQISPGTSLHK
jgi:hypothetical protein